MMQKAQEVGLPGRPGLGEHALQMGAHGRLADAEHVGRLHAAQSLGKRQQHAKFSAGQSVKPGKGLTGHQWRLNRSLRERGYRRRERRENAAAPTALDRKEGRNIASAVGIRDRHGVFIQIHGVAARRLVDCL